MLTNTGSREDRLVAFDTETHKIQPGLLAPPLVCGSVGDAVGGRLLDRADTRKWFRKVLVDATIIAGANIAYDMAVMAVDAARIGEDLLPQIFAKYRDGCVWDVAIAEQLHAIAEGTLGRFPDTGRDTRYSLDDLVQIILGRSDAKERDTWRTSYALLEHVPLHEWPVDARQYPVDDAVNTYQVARAQLARNRNQHEVPIQSLKAFCLHLGAVHGLRTDPSAVAILRASAEALAESGHDAFVDLGIVRPDGGAITKAIKTRVAVAYGAGGVCAGCSGTGESLGKGKRAVQCKRCSATGLDLERSAVPRTAPSATNAYGSIRASRDVLVESGDETLRAYAEHLEDAKILSTYVPFLEEGATTPICLRPNAILETGRVSYNGPIQLLPRQVSPRLREELARRGGPLGVRDCFVARPGHVFFSVDYSGGELVTFAEACHTRVQYSRMGDELNAGRDVHSVIAARIAKLSYDDFIAAKKVPRNKALRQAAKPINFGCPGGIGAPKIVLQQRVSGPDTPHPSGPILVRDDADQAWVPGYKGLRFCILVGGAERCGVEMDSGTSERPITPVCAACLKVATELRNEWFVAFPEARGYLAWHAKNVNDHGFVEQIYSGRIRANEYMTSAANGDFQALLADIAGRALIRVTAESYTNRRSPIFGARTAVFAHDELFGEIPEELASDGVARIEEIMVDEFRKGCPNHYAACRAEAAIARRWYKAMEPVRDGKGDLIPWEPKKR